MNSLISILLIITATTGLLNAAVFTALIIGSLQADSPVVSRVCRLDSKDCQAVVTSPRARLLFGIPNTVPGMVWYVACLLIALDLRDARSALYGLYLVASGVTVVVSAYLMWSLIVRLKARCKFCFLGHACNAIIFFLLLFCKV